MTQQQEEEDEDDEIQIQMKMRNQKYWFFLCFLVLFNYIFVKERKNKILQSIFYSNRDEYKYWIKKFQNKSKNHKNVLDG